MNHISMLLKSSDSMSLRRAVLAASCGKIEKIRPYARKTKSFSLYILKAA
jgi:hypothetical protein